MVLEFVRGKIRKQIVGKVIARASERASGRNQKQKDGEVWTARHGEVGTKVSAAEKQQKLNSISFSAHEARLMRGLLLKPGNVAWLPLL